MSQVSRPRPRRGVVAAAVALSIALAATLVLSGGDPAGAAAPPRAQAVGRFLDGAAGGMPVQSIADLHDARATNPGTVTDQNPLEATVGGQGDIPLTGALQLPGSGNAFHVGAANQVAKALSNGFSYGASGAIANSGGASAGGNNNAYPADASIELSPAAIPNPGTLPLPGASSAAALGGVTAEIGAVSALATTPVGFGKPGDTAYNIAALKLTLASPALGNVLKMVGAALVAPTLPAPLPAGFALPQDCSFTTQALSNITLDQGAVTIDPTTGSITVDVAALLKVLGVDLNNLPANTDLLAYVLNYLSGANGLGKGLQDVVSGLTNPLSAQFDKCVNEFPPPVSQVAKPVLAAITAGQTQVTDAINGVVDQLTAAGGANPFAPLTSGLKMALQIGVNVQPHAASHGYTSPLKATPDQATSVVAGQTVVRAIEIDLGGGQISLALANAAAGPSSFTATSPTHSATPLPSHSPAAPNTEIPTGVPAGHGTAGGTPTLPLVLLVLAGLMGGAGALAWRARPARH